MTLVQRLFYVIRGALIAPFFSWLTVVLAVLVVYALSASAPALGDATWQDAASWGSSFWLTAFGGQMPLGAATGADAQTGAGVLSLMPLTVTLTHMLVSYRSFRARGIVTWLDVILVVGVQVAFVAIIGLIFGQGSSWWIALVGIGVMAVGLAIFAGREYLFSSMEWYEYATDAWGPIRLLLRTLALIAIAFAIVTLIAGFSRIMEIHGYYLTTPLGSVGLVILQLLYVPNLLIWGLAWVFGPGFAVGTGTNFSALGSESGPLPAIPVFGAIPDVSTEIPWLPAVVVLLFLVLGVVHAVRNFGDRSRRDVALLDLGVGLTVSLVMSVLSLMASGSIGPGRMADVGVQPSLMFAAVLLLVALPFAIGHMIGHPRSRAKVMNVVEGVKSGKPTDTTAAVEE